MHLLGVCALIIALAALLIIGFCDVAQDLLSRVTITAPSWPNEEQPPNSSLKSLSTSLPGGQLVK